MDNDSIRDDTGPERLLINKLFNESAIARFVSILDDNVVSSSPLPGRSRNSRAVLRLLLVTVEVGVDVLSDRLC